MLLTLLPTFKSACDLAHRLPGLLASFMDLELALGRRFREDGLSDLVIASFLQIPGLSVVVRTPDEFRTGSDFDLALVDPASNTAIQYRIQAKRLGRPTATWKTRSYRELAHPHGTGGQVQTLCNLSNLAGTVPTIPLYAFYNPECVCASAGLPGITLADAFEIENHVLTSLATKPRPRFKQLNAVMPHFFTLDILLCPPTKEIHRSVCTPQESRDAFVQGREARPTSVLAAMKGRPTPEVGKIPRELLTALRRSEVARVIKAPIERPQLVIATSELNDMPD